MAVRVEKGVAMVCAGANGISALCQCGAGAATVLQGFSDCSVGIFHPREIDPEHPRLPMNLKRRFKSYRNLRTTEQKIRRILADFEITSFQCLLANGWTTGLIPRCLHFNRPLRSWQKSTNRSEDER
jgi:uncharacterized protein DUF3473